jgi:hypothetical protein
MKLNREKFLTAAFALAAASGCSKLGDEISLLASPEKSAAPSVQNPAAPNDNAAPVTRGDSEERSGPRPQSTARKLGVGTSPTDEKGFIGSPTTEKGITSPTKEAFVSPTKEKLPTPTAEVGAKKPYPSPVKEY